MKRFILFGAAIFLGSAAFGKETTLGISSRVVTWVCGTPTQPIETQPAGIMHDDRDSDVCLEADIHAAKENRNGFAEADWMSYPSLTYVLRHLDNKETRKWVKYFVGCVFERVRFGTAPMPAFFGKFSVGDTEIVSDETKDYFVVGKLQSTRRLDDIRQEHRRLACKLRSILRLLGAMTGNYWNQRVSPAKRRQDCGGEGHQNRGPADADAWGGLIRRLAERARLASRLTLEIIESCRSTRSPGSVFAVSASLHGVDADRDIVKMDRQYFGDLRKTPSGSHGIPSLAKLTACLVPVVIFEGIEMKDHLDVEGDFGQGSIYERSVQERYTLPNKPTGARLRAAILPPGALLRPSTDTSIDRKERRGFHISWIDRLDERMREPDACAYAGGAR